MEKALAIFEKTEDGTKAVFFDQESIECARLNLRTKKRMDEAQEAQAEENIKIRKAAAKKAKFKAYTTRTFCTIAVDSLVVWAAVQAGIAGLIHPVVYLPVALFFLCAACVCLGAWIGKVANK